MKITFKSLIGKVLLVGITYNDKDGNVKERKQFWGTVTVADKKQNSDRAEKRRDTFVAVRFESDRTCSRGGVQTSFHGRGCRKS